MQNSTDWYRNLFAKCIREVERMVFLRIRDMREDADMTQAQVAEMLGIAQTVYSRYERGYQTFPLSLLIRPADKYNASLDYLTGRTATKEINRAD